MKNINKNISVKLTIIEFFVKKMLKKNLECMKNERNEMMNNNLFHSFVHCYCLFSSHAGANNKNIISNEKIEQKLLLLCNMALFLTLQQRQYVRFKIAMMTLIPHYPNIFLPASV